MKNRYFWFISYETLIKITNAKQLINFEWFVIKASVQTTIIYGLRPTNSTISKPKYSLRLHFVCVSLSLNGIYHILTVWQEPGCRLQVRKFGHLDTWTLGPSRIPSSWLILCVQVLAHLHQSLPCMRNASQSVTVIDSGHK